MERTTPQIAAGFFITNPDVSPANNQILPSLDDVLVSNFSLVFLRHRNNSITEWHTIMPMVYFIQTSKAFTINSVNNYVIPVRCGTLILEYRDSCFSFILNAINAGNITDEVLEAFGIVATVSGASTFILCPPLMILTIITPFLIKFYMWKY